jgi:hypothetical protein
MKTTKALFFELMYDFQSERWNEFELPKRRESRVRPGRQFVPDSNECSG